VLFNSYVFILVFLPVTLLGFFTAQARGSARAGLVWLVACSLFFYGWWSPPYLLLLGASIAVNHALGLALLRSSGTRQRWLLIGGIAGNLALLAYYKYAAFLLESAAALLGAERSAEPGFLPLGISFFTFTQIVYLVDTVQGKTRPGGALGYTLFVTFFPHLIAGPIVHHRELMPQLESRLRERTPLADLAAGLAIFAAGLFKKVMLADPLVEYVTGPFAAADAGVAPSFGAAWIAALAYTLQLYFDFSGYSDMAIGLSCMFGVRLPLNFDSPYKASSIVDFWRRWHVTLSRMLRDYLYIPLGGNRHGAVRRHVNLMITMLLGGLWHGAGWTFVAWGGLHGALLVINHLWRALRARLGLVAGEPGSARWLGGRAATFVCVVAAWVLFRAHSLEGAGRILASMAGLNGFSLEAAFEIERALRLIAPLLLVVWLAPHTQEIFADARPVYGAQPEPARLLRWRPTFASACAAALVAAWTLLHLSRASEFLYYQF
jgi:D-alanyl-lipoteichoic acid acyltransferase DltB (MBOAT superfamily)